MHKPSKIRFPLQAKLLLPVLAVLIFLPVTIVWILDRQVERDSREQSIKALTNVRAILRTFLDNREQMLIKNVEDLSRDPQFHSAVNSGDKKRLEHILSTWLQAKVDHVAVFSSHESGLSSAGLLLDEIEDPQQLTTRLISIENPTNQNQLQVEWTSFSNRAFQVVSLPVFNTGNDREIGSLGLAQMLGEKAAQGLRSLTRTEVLLLLGDQCVASTLEQTSLNRDAPSLIQEAILGGIDVRQQNINDERFHVVSGRLDHGSAASEPLSYILLSSYEEQFQAHSTTKTLLMSVSLLSIGISVLTISILTGKIIKPLKALKERAEAISRGEFGDRIEIHQSDECGELASSFNKMTSSLQSSRADLESNLEELHKTQKLFAQRESQLRESEEGLRLIIEGARDHVIFTVEDNGKIKRWNGAAERMLGYRSDEVSDIGYHQFFCEEDQMKGVDRKMLSKALDQGRAEFEGWRVGKDGNRFWADVTLSRLDKLPGERGGGYVEIARDISTRKRAEKALVEARNAAEASNRAKNEFMGNMSHEIRTPMNGIIGMTSLLLEDDMNEEHRDLVETIKTSADSLLAIIDDILDISKIEAGQMEINPEPVNLLELIEITVDSFAHICDKKGLSLNVCIGKEVPQLFETDPTRIRQVISNLLGNAVKFTEKGGIRVDVSFEPSNKELVISVQDSGIGIPKDKIRQLFNPFFQVESTTSRRFGGTGLGLSISRKIAQLLKGEIRVESMLNLGSRFSFISKSKPLDGGCGLLAFPRSNILLLTDNPLSKISLEDQIHNWDSYVKSVDITPQNLEYAIQDDSYDVVIVDDSDNSAGNPVLTIEPILAKLAEQSTPYIRILAHNQKARSPWPGTGVNLNKPVQPSELNAAFSRLLLTEQERQPHSTMTAGRKVLDADFANQYPHEILIVEDNAINAKVLETILRKLGYKPKLAENGEACLRALKKVPYDIIFMDLQMPVMDGYTTTDRILNSNTIDHLPFITAFTANARQEDRDACLAAGMHDFVAKPARPRKIIDVILRAHAWLEERVPVRNQRNTL